MFVLVVLLFWLGTETVSAGVLTSTATSVSSSGTGFKVDWSQGCLDTTRSYGGKTITLESTGPNSCDNDKPWMCPVDSTGVSSEWEQNCSACGCGWLSQCQSNGTCQSCVDPCDRKPCSSGYVCNTVSPSSEGACPTYRCDPVLKSVAFEFHDTPPFCDYEFSGITAPIPINDPQRYAGKMYISVVCPWNSYDFIVGWNSGGPYCYHPGTYDGFYNTVCKFAGYAQITQCWWYAGGSTTSTSFGAPLTSGSSTGPQSYSCSGIFGTTHGADLDVRNVVGTYQCKKSNAWGAAGGMNFYVNGKLCGTSWT